MNMRIKLATNLLLKNLLLNFIIILQLCALLTFGNIVIGLRNNLYECYNLTEGFDGDNTLLYMPVSGEFSEYGSKQTYLSDNIGGATVEYTKQYDVYSESYEILTFGYGEKTANVMRSGLVSGKWFGETEPIEGVIDCVVAGNRSQFPIGTIIDTRAYESDLASRNTFGVSFRIIGYMGTSVQIPQFTANSDDMSIDYIFKKYSCAEGSIIDNLFNHRQYESHNQNPYDAVLIFDGDIDNCSYICSENAFVFLDKNADTTAAVSKLKNSARVCTVSSARTLSKQEAADSMIRYIPLCICFVVLGIAGVLCVSLLNMIKNKKVFKAYSISGMSFAQGMGILVTYALELLLIAFMLFIMLFAALASMQILPWESMSTNFSNVLFLVMIALVTVVTMTTAGGTLLNKYINALGGNHVTVK